MLSRLYTIVLLVFVSIFYFRFSFAKAKFEIKDSLSNNKEYVKAKNCLDSADYNCAKSLLLELLKKAEGRDNYHKIAQYNLDLGDVFYQTRDFKEANSHYDKALTLGKVNKFTRIVADAKQKNAHIEWRYGDNYAAINNISESIKLYESLGDTSSFLHARAILAGIYISLNKFNESESIYDELLKIAVSISDTASIATCNEHLGVIAFYKEDYEHAIELYNNALNLNQKRNERLSAALSMANIGEAYLELGNLNVANEYLQKSLETLNEFNFTSGKIFVLHTLGRVHHELLSYKNAHKFYLLSLGLINNTGEIRERNFVYKLISENFAEQGDFKEALTYYKRYSEEKDSLFSIEKAKQLEMLRAQYSLEESESKNQLLNQENIKAQHEISVKERLLNYQYFISATVLLSLLIFIFQFYSLRKSKKKLEISNNTKNRLFNIIAHDIKNPVGNILSLTNLLEKAEDESTKHKIFEMLKSSSKSITVLVNSILSWSISNTENFEFKYTKLNLHDLIDRVSGLFVYDISEKQIRLNNKVDVNCELKCDEDIVSTIVRNLLSNAIKFTPKNGEISIWISITDKFKEIHVKDSGIGMDEATKMKIIGGNKVISSEGTNHEKGNGIGFTLINDFVEKFKGKIDIISAINQGTEVIVSLPKQHN